MSEANAGSDVVSMKTRADRTSMFDQVSQKVIICIQLVGGS